MLQTDVAIVGGGLAGSTAAAMLGRAGVDAVLIDPHAAYPFDFRCEKLDRSQLALLQRTGLADHVLTAGAHAGEIWIVRRGQLMEKRENHQYGILYETLVNRMRGAIPETTRVVVAKAASISTSVEKQVVTLSNGEEISARLVVLANGLNSALRQNLGMRRDDISAGHSIAIGFDIAPRGGGAFPFRALTWHPESPSRRAAYLTLFPTAQAMRANLFVYRDMRDPWLSRMRNAPMECLAELPGFNQAVGDYEIVGRVHIRPVDLYETRDHERHGIVLVGDAFATSCPAAGTGANKVLTDAVRLCGEYIPRWLGTAGMGAEKIAAFYADPEKRAADAMSKAKAFRLRDLSVNGSATWRARRAARHLGQIGVAALRRGRMRVAALGRARPSAAG